MISKLEILEKRLAEFAGPIAPFVVKKQLKDMCLAREDVTDADIPNLVKRCVVAAIFDPSLQPVVERSLLKSLTDTA